MLVNLNRYDDHTTKRIFTIPKRVTRFIRLIISSNESPMFSPSGKPGKQNEEEPQKQILQHANNKQQDGKHEQPENNSEYTSQHH